MVEADIGRRLPTCDQALEAGPDVVGVDVALGVGGERLAGPYGASDLDSDARQRFARLDSERRSLASPDRHPVAAKLAAKRVDTGIP